MNASNWNASDSEFHLQKTIIRQKMCVCFCYAIKTEDRDKAETKNIVPGMNVPK